MSDITVIHMLYTADPTSAPAVSEKFGYLKGDTNGILWSRPITALGAQTSRDPDNDAIDPEVENIVALDVACFNYIWDETNSRWDRERRLVSADNMTDSEARLVISQLIGFDGANWDRIRIGAENADAVAAETLGVLKTTTKIQGYNGATFDRLRSEGNDNDAVAVKTLGILESLSHALLFNGASWDRKRNNHEITLLTSAARTVDVNSGDKINYNSLGGHFSIDVTEITATPSVVFTIEGKDSLSGKYYDILVSSAITAVGTTILRVYPGITVTANLSVADILPRTFRLKSVHDDTDSITYSVGFSAAA